MSSTIGQSTLSTNYIPACGAAFEDLTSDEMMDYDGGWTGALVGLLAPSSLACAGGAALGALVVTAVTLIVKATR